MSRIGKLPISIPAGVTIAVSDDNKVTVKGPKGEMSQVVDPSIKVNIADAEVTFEIVEENDAVETKQKQAFHGLYRSLINNMVVGVSEGYKKQLELVGVGYRVSNQGNLLEFALGYTHPILLQLPSEIKVETKSERNQNPQIILESCDKQLLGQVCAKIRSFRKPEPYKGKGILFAGEQIRRKSKLERRIKIKYRVRNKISGTAERPRMSVFRSNKQIYVQIINDMTGTTLVSASSLGMETCPKKEQAAKVGELAAKKALEAGITTVEHVTVDLNSNELWQIKLR